MESASTSTIETAVRRAAGEGRRAVLLTGATGFVGGELLRRLVRRDAREIVCLVRGETEQDAAERGRAREAALFGASAGSACSGRIRWVRADLERPRLGLSEAAFRALAAGVDEIFHCAASVDFDLPLEVAHRINVGGVEELVALARAAGPDFVRFHHVSTAYVAGRRSGSVDARFLPPDDACLFRNTYERTKARAERFLRAQGDVAISVYRPSIVAGDTDTGRTDNWNVLYAPMRQIVKGRLPMIRRAGRALVDTVGVDYVVDGLVALADRARRDGASVDRFQSHHLTAGRHAFDLEFYLRHCNEAARRGGVRGATRAVGPAIWWTWSKSVTALAYAPASLGRTRALGEAARSALRSFTPYLAYTEVDVVFQADAEQRVLAEAGVCMPAAEVYLPRIVRFACETDFGRRAQPEPTRTEPSRERRSGRRRFGPARTPRVDPHPDSARASAVGDAR